MATLWMEVDTGALVQFMEHRDETVRSLAAKCIVKDGRTRRPRLLSPAAVGHLRSGARTTCSLRTAKAIESALNVPPGIVFRPRSSTVNKAA